MKLTFAILKICVADMLQAPRDTFMTFWHTNRLLTVLVILSLLCVPLNLVVGNYVIAVINLVAAIYGFTTLHRCAR